MGRLLVVPLFPQYSATTTAAVVDSLAVWLGRQREIPALHIVKDYWQDEGWQQVLANRINRFQEKAGKPDKLVFSFHGIPQACEDRGDHYPERCRATAAAIARRLGLTDDAWVCSFQSRFGKAPWVKPYTDMELIRLAGAGIGRVQVVCPGFAMDCLETIDEVACLLRDQFLKAGGKQLEYIPALNASDLQQGWLSKLIERQLVALH
jgi:ferrochelatase